MENPMNEKIDKAMEIVLGLVRTNSLPADAMNITQAALNLAHTKLCLQGDKPTKAKQTTIKGSGS